MKCTADEPWGMIHYYAGFGTCAEGQKNGARLTNEEVAVTCPVCRMYLESESRNEQPTSDQKSPEALAGAAARAMPEAPRDSGAPLTSKPMREHLFSYSLDGALWGIGVVATDERDARRRLAEAERERDRALRVIGWGLEPLRHLMQTEAEIARAADSAEPCRHDGDIHEEARGIWRCVACNELSIDKFGRVNASTVDGSHAD